MTLPTAQVDISQFVEEVKRFNAMTEPFAFLLHLWDDLRRWRYPVMTGCLWLLCNLGCLILSQDCLLAAVFTLVFLIVILNALMCLIQLHTRLLDKFLPVTTTTEFQDDLIGEHSAIQTIRNFELSLLQMHEFIRNCNQYLRFFYCLLKWDFTLPSLRLDWTTIWEENSELYVKTLGTDKCLLLLPSSNNPFRKEVLRSWWRLWHLGWRFHVEVCFLLLCLVVCPGRWTAFLLTNWFFLATDQVYTGCRRRVVNFIESMPGKRSLAATFENQSQSNHNGSSQKTGAEVEDVELVPNSESKPGMVARLMDLKRRRKIINTETCFECKASFSSILKRRNTCCHCGNSFCSKCCNQKVPKSLLGVTAPSTQTDLVLVCVICYNLLLD